MYRTSLSKLRLLNRKSGLVDAALCHGARYTLKQDLNFWMFNIERKIKNRKQIIITTDRIKRHSSLDDAFFLLL